MAVLDFPKDPQPDQIYKFPPFEYQWDGEKWRTIGRGSTPAVDLINEHKAEKDAHNYVNITGLPAELAKSVKLDGTNISTGQHGINHTSNGSWIAANFGTKGADGVVVTGSLARGAVIGGHSEAFTNWKPLYINTFPGIIDDHEGSPVIVANPKRQLVINSDTGSKISIIYPLVAKGVRTGNPNWWIAPHVLRFLDGVDLMLAATNGARRAVDMAYVTRYKYSVRLSVHAPSVNIWSNVYGFEIYNYQGTNSSDVLEVPSQFDCHAGGYRRAAIKKQMVPNTENNGMPYFELHFDSSLNVQGAPDLSVRLEVIAENIFE
ncbi:MAG: hypothetical protein ACRDC4_13070 [Plesiomonas sp.]